MISIIIPVYNVAPYLRKCMDSVCNQTYRDIEIIAVNDGSKDESLDILKEYAAKDSRIVIIDQPNSGVSAARNAGLERATGEYVLFLDGDDWIDLDTCALALMTVQQSGAQLVVWNYYREYATSSQKTTLFGQSAETFSDESAKQFHRRIVGPTGKEIKMPNLLDSYSTAWGKLYRRDLIADCKFIDTKLVGSEDILFNVQVLYGVMCVAYLPSYLSHYRKSNQTSLTTGYSDQIVIRWMELTRRIQILLDEHQVTEEYYQALTNRICCSLIGLGFRLFFDQSMSARLKLAEMRRLLSTSYYHNSLIKMERDCLPSHWKLYFWGARNNHPYILMWLYYVMNILRKIH